MSSNSKVQPISSRPTPRSHEVGPRTHHRVPRREIHPEAIVVRTPEAEQKYFWRRVFALGAIGVVAAGAYVGLVQPAIDAQGESVSLPDRTTEAGAKKIEAGLEEGSLIEVMTDINHTTLYSVADALTDGDPRALSDALSDEMGGRDDELPLGTRVAVPRTEESIRLHQEQFGE